MYILLYSYDFLMIFVEIFHDFGWFFATRIRIRFIEADPDPADQNKTDPNGSGSGSTTLVCSDCHTFFETLIFYNLNI